MSDISDEHVPHEQEHAEATDAQMRRTSEHGPIDLLSTPASNNYDRAEQTTMVNTINEIIKVLRDAELIPLT